MTSRGTGSPYRAAAPVTENDIASLDTAEVKRRVDEATELLSRLLTQIATIPVPDEREQGDVSRASRIVGLMRRYAILLGVLLASGLLIVLLAIALGAPR